MGTGKSGIGGGSTKTTKFASSDNGPFRAMTDAEEAAYMLKQGTTAAQQSAYDLYTNPNTTPGSLYNFSQNMNYHHANGGMTQTEKDVFDTIEGAMHNIGYNAELTRYDHPDVVTGILSQLGITKDAGSMTAAQLKKNLVGVTYKDDRILSTSVNDFKNSDDPSTFNTRIFKFTYKTPANAQGVMPGVGKTPMKYSGKSSGDNFGEMLLSSKSNYRITDVRYTGKKARKKGSPKWNLNKKQIEIVVEVF